VVLHDLVEKLWSTWHRILCARCLSQSQVDGVRDLLPVILGEDFIVKVTCQFHCLFCTVINHLQCTNNLACGSVVSTIEGVSANT